MKRIHMVHGCCDGETVSAAGHRGCCSMTRRFVSKEERREALEAYRTELKKELTGVEERLDELK